MILKNILYGVKINNIEEIEKYIKKQTELISCTKEVILHHEKQVRIYNEQLKKEELRLGEITESKDTVIFDGHFCSFKAGMTHTFTNIISNGKPINGTITLTIT